MSGEGRHYELLCEAHREYMMRLCEAERERDEARAWAKRWEQCERDLEKRAEQAERERDEARAEVEHMRRGIEAYRTICVCPKEVAAGKQHVWLRDGFGKDVPCESCAWEREDAKRQEERVDER